MLILRIALLMIALLPLASPEVRGGKVEYIGGTVGELSHAPKGQLSTTDQEFLVFLANKARFTVQWEKINLLEYGQRVNRRYTLGVLISPMLALSKSRKHYLTIAFTDNKGGQQAMVFRVNKDDIRSLLVSLEARTNLKVEFQDEDARKGGKG